jgi:hypothetical protein
MICMTKRKASSERKGFMPHARAFNKASQEMARQPREQATRTCPTKRKGVLTDKGGMLPTGGQQRVSTINS